MLIAPIQANMSLEKQIRKEAYGHVLSLFSREIPGNLLYHSFGHTDEMLKAVRRIMEEDPVESQELCELVLIAAIFHDTGYTRTYDEHEKESCVIAEEYLRAKNLDEEKIARVKELILATRSGYIPVNKAEAVLHDADYVSLGKRSFFEKSDLLRREWELALNRTYSDLEWNKLQLEFLENHRFYTVYGQRKLEPGKAMNILRVKENISKLEARQNKSSEKEKPSRGVETMYRSIYRNHIGLSAIADRKANMMISINTIIISVIMSFIGSGLTLLRGDYIHNLRFTIPLIMLLITSSISVTFAILSARPNLREKKEDSRESILFFGTFSSYPVDRFVTGMQALQAAPVELYDNMSVDIYNLGAVLQRKYRLLRISYTCFLAGLVITVVAFISILGFSVR